MLISSSDVRLRSDRTAVELHQRTERLVAWQDTAGGRVTEELAAGDGSDPSVRARALAQAERQGGIGVEISSHAKSLQPVPTQTDALPPPADDYQSVQISVVKMLFEKLTGRKFELFDANELHQRMSGRAHAGNAAGNQTVPAREGSEGEGWGLQYDYYESHYEAESTSFCAQGVVQTADGREIAFSVDLAMSREFMSQASLSIRAGDALKDPLVINFGGKAAELTDTRFSFDVDADGREEQIAFVRPGSGFLALDRNGDGVVNDGSELFGPRTGDGFAEVAAYDADGNEWIDEADPIYSGLRIWSRDASGNDSLFALGEQGIGAIYLGNVATPFALKDAENADLGQVRSTGVFLNEDGGAGTIQQVDLVV